MIMSTGFLDGLKRERNIRIRLAVEKQATGVPPRGGHFIGVHSNASAAVPSQLSRSLACRQTFHSPRITAIYKHSRSKIKTRETYFVVRDRSLSSNTDGVYLDNSFAYACDIPY